jgi:hypothetical protein
VLPFLRAGMVPFPDTGFCLILSSSSNSKVQKDATGGTWQYPQHQTQYTQRDESGNWVNWVYPSSAQQQQQQAVSQRRRDTPFVNNKTVV